MNKTDFIKLKGRITCICRNWGISYQDIEDCIQWVALKRSEGKGQHQLLSHSVVDWMREFYVSKKRKDYEKAKLFSNAREYNSAIDGRIHEEYITNDIFRMIELIKDYRVQDIVYQRIVFNEYISVLGKKYGVSSSRISQLYKKGIAEIKNKIKRF